MPPSTPSHAEQVRALFDALSDLPREAQRARLAEVLDARLRRDVAALLAHDTDAEARLAPYAHVMHARRTEVLDATADGQAGERIGGRYVLEQRVGAGGMGVVYRARDERLHRTVALKFLPQALHLDAEAKARFYQEARAAARFDHPHIATVFEIDEAEDGQLFIVMAYAAGETLKARLARGPLPEDAATGIARQLIDALGYAHARGIVHRDVKPSNIVCDADGSIRLLDFGIAKIAAADQTRTGAILGTAAYMSPEQASGQPVDARTDVWAVGVVLYEMLTGRKPFAGDSDLAVASAILHATPPALSAQRPDLAPHLVHLVERAMAKNPAQRFPSMAAMARALGEPAPRVGRGPARGGHRYALALLAIALLVGLAWWGRARTPPRPPDVRHALAVLYFDNLTGAPELDWAEAGMVEMLTANLGQFADLDVVSSQRLYDLTRQVSGDGAALDRETATTVARRGGAQTMVLGSLVADGARVRVNAQLVDVPSGTLLGTEVLDAPDAAALSALADTLTLRIVQRLGVAARGRAQAARVAYTLTSSPDALQAYVRGVQALYAATYQDAARHFEAAIDADTAFALAYYYKALATAWQTGDPDRPDLERALHFGDALSPRERALVAATLTMDGTLPERKKAFEALIARYPDEKFARYQLGEIQYHNYWPRASVASFDAALRLDSHFVLSYIHPIDVAFHTDDYAAARGYLDGVRARDSLNAEFRFSHALLDFATDARPDAHADLAQALRALASDPALTPSTRLDAQTAIALTVGNRRAHMDSLRAFRAAGHYGNEGYLLATNSLAGFALLQGDLAGAERFLAEARARQPGSPAQLYEDGLFRLLRGRADEVPPLARRILRLHDDGSEPFAEVLSLGWHLLFRAALARADEATQQQSLEALARLKADRRSEYGFLYDDARGRRACAEGRIDAALQSFADARARVSFTGTQGGVSLLFSKLLLEAELGCLVQAGDFGAVARRTAAASVWVYHFHDTNTSTMAAYLQSRLYQARALEALGRPDEARQRYRLVLSLWEEAREVPPGIAEARQRYAALEARADG